MATKKTIKNIDVSSASFPVTINLDSRVSTYRLYGTLALSTNIAITPDGTPVAGMVVMFDYQATITGTDNVTLFGTLIPSSMRSLKCKIFCEYTGSAWAVYIVPSADSMPYVGEEALASTVVDDSTIAQDGTTKKLKVKSGGITATQLASDAVETAKIKDDAVTLAKMYDITRGYVIVGGASDAPSILNAKTSGQILVGDGTDLKSVAVTGDISLTSAGVTAVGSQKILASMLGLLQIANAHVSATAALVWSKMAALSASVVPVTDSNGFITSSAITPTELGYLSATPGTAAASKAVILDGSKKISDLDITALKINGTSVTATAAELNYLSGATSAVQTQIDTLQTKVTMKKVTTDETVTVSTLKQFYYVDTTAANVTVNLPAISTLSESNDGQTVQILNYKGSNDAVLAAFAGDSIDNMGSDDASITLATGGDWVKVTFSYSEGAWIVMSKYITTP